LAAEQMGQVSLAARDLIDYLPKAFLQYARSVNHATPTDA
jgi:hypothetical protein